MRIPRDDHLWLRHDNKMEGHQGSNFAGDDSPHAGVAPSADHQGDHQGDSFYSAQNGYGHQGMYRNHYDAGTSDNVSQEQSGQPHHPYQSAVSSAFGGGFNAQGFQGPPPGDMAGHAFAGYNQPSQEYEQYRSNSFQSGAGQQQSQQGYGYPGMHAWSGSNDGSPAALDGMPNESGQQHSAQAPNEVFSQQQEHQYALAQHEMQLRLMQQRALAFQNGHMPWYPSQANVPVGDAAHAAPPHPSMYMGHESAMGYKPHPPPSEMTAQDKKIAKRANRRPKDPNKPKRPLSAYNLFFKDERLNMLKELVSEDTETAPKKGAGDDGTSTEDDDKRKAVADPDVVPPPAKKRKGVGFAPMAKKIAAKWKEIDEQSLKKYKEVAVTDMGRYRKEMEAYRKKHREGPAGSVEQADPQTDEES
jgi:hypothetical protein